MTAINSFTRLGAAYLLADGATCDLGDNPDHGKVVEIRSKIATSARLRVAICVTGVAVTSDFQGMLDQMLTQEEALGAIPDMARLAQQWHREGLAAEGINLNPQFRMEIALFSKVKDEPALYNYATRDFGFGYEPETLRQVRASLQPTMVEHGGLSASDLCDPAKFDVNRDAVALLEGQRKRPPDLGVKHCGIGGFVELVRVDRGGIKRRILHRWPQDRVGSKIAV